MFCGQFFKDFIYLFLGRGEGKEKERETKIDVREKYQLVASRTPPTRYPNCNLGVYPDQESNLQTFGA